MCARLEKNKRVVIWGTGEVSKHFLQIMNHDSMDILFFVDNSTARQGQKIGEWQILNPTVLKESALSYDLLILALGDWELVYRQAVCELKVLPDKIENAFLYHKHQLVQYYKEMSGFYDEEAAKVLDYINNHPLGVFNYDFTVQYQLGHVEAFYDINRALYYVIFQGKRMYMSREFKSKDQVCRYYRQLLMEQDIQSPHCYLNASFQLDEHSVVLDAGAAEGIFALSVIDKADKIYLVESDEVWIEALRYTFEDCIQKVVFVNRYLSDKNDDNNITVDGLIKKDRLDFIKMDIEGAELSALYGAVGTLTEQNCKLDICVYHREQDESDISSFLKKIGYSTFAATGYMVYIHGDNMLNTDTRKLVRGVLRGEKTELDKKVFIFGAPAEAELVQKILRPESTKVLGYLDNNKERQGMKLQGGMEIYDPNRVKIIDFDVIIIALQKPVNIRQVKAQMESLGVSKNKVVEFFFTDCVYKKQWGWLLDTEKWEQITEVTQLRLEMEQFRREVMLWKNNCFYEIKDAVYRQDYRFPKIADENETIKRLIDGRFSLCRFGDGEFEIMRGEERPRFQKYSVSLAERLQEIFDSDCKEVLIGIPDFFGSLNQYMDYAATDIREYLKPQVREYLEDIVDYGKVYHNAYLSRAYIIYRDKTECRQRFDSLKKIWSGRDVVLIEGNKTRMGIGNDLLKGAKSVQRIIGPAENAFEQYEQIFYAAQTFEPDKLFLICLGPAATVLAYDLSMAGYQAIDIGHLDIEYEWFLMGAMDRVVLPYKYVNEVWGGSCVKSYGEKLYKEQIVYDFSNIEEFGHCHNIS